MKISVRIVAAFAAIYFLWGATYLAITIGLRTIPPFLLMAMRCAIGGLLLLVIAARYQRSEARFKHWLRAAISGVLLFLGCHGLLAVAEKSTPSSFAAVVLATIPFWIVLLNTIRHTARDRSYQPLPTYRLDSSGLLRWRGQR